MAAYDPKRPRPRADGEEPAPVEALLDPDPAEPVAVAEPAEVRYVVELEDPDPAPDDAAPVEPAADSAAGARRARGGEAAPTRRRRIARTRDSPVPTCRWPNPRRSRRPTGRSWSWGRSARGC